MELQPILFLSTDWMLVGTPGLLSNFMIVVILYIRAVTSTVSVVEGLFYAFVKE